MRKLVILILSFCLLFCGCYGTTAEKSEDYKPVTVNLPEDNTVNGYRTGSALQGELPNKISGNDIAVDNGSHKNKSTSYCGNKNSRVFHKSTCSSVSSMSESNKVYLSGRDEFIKKGYKPCSRCNP